MKAKIEANFIDALVAQLKAQDTRCQPDNITTDSIQPTLDVGFGGFNQYVVSGNNKTNISIAGVAGSSGMAVALIGTPGFKSVFAAGVTDTDPWIPLVLKNGRMIAAHGKVTFDAAGAGAWAGKVMRFELRLYYTATAACRLALVDVTIGAALFYEVHVCQQMDVRNYFVPNICSLKLHAWDYTASAAFPANTVFSGGVVAITQGRNAELPL